MAREKKDIFLRIRHVASLALRPSYIFRRLREIIREMRRKEVKSNMPLDSLPKVTLLAANGDSELEMRLVNIYAANPSRLVSGPMNIEMLRDNQSKNFEFYIAVDSNGNDSAAIAFDNDRLMSCHLVTDFRHRSKGLGLSAMIELEKRKINEGVSVFWGQVYRNNPRMLSLVLSMGFRIVEEESTDDYFTIRKIILRSGDEQKL